MEYEKYKDLPKVPSSFDPTGAGIIPFEGKSTQTLTSAVFGYFPYWKYPEAVSNMQFDLLSHIAVFDFSVSADGTISPPSAWPWTDLINLAHTAGVKVILTAINFTGSQIHQLLTDQTARENFFNQLKNQLQTYDLQGVNIDFEGIYQSDRGEVLNGFMAELTYFLHEEIPGSEVSIAVPPVNWGGWQFTGLANACDYMFIMGYNFYGPWSETSGPCAPLTGGSYNISRTVNQEFDEVSDSQPEKLILGVPYYGNRWKTEDGEAYAAVVEHLNQPTYSLAKNTADEHGILWDDISQTPFCSYIENESWYQVWYDSDTSLGLKYDLADNNNYKGIGMWALGYDSDKPELWDEIRRRYEGTSSVSESNYKPVDIQVYVTGEGILKIKAVTIKNAQVSAMLYNMQGRLMYELSGKSSSQGIYRDHIAIKQLPGGMYIVKILVMKENDLKTGVQKVLIR